MKQILICDDDHEIVEAISIYLKNEGYKCILCYNGEDALKHKNKQNIDLIIMDIMMPGIDGLSVVKKIRETSTVPIIFLSAKSEDNDKIEGFNIGADDYIPKPFNMLELVARVKSILKRTDNNIKTEKKEKNTYKNGNLKVDTTAKLVLLGKEEIKVTPIELNLLIYFMQNIGKVVSSNDIYKAVWHQCEAFNIENTVAVHIRHLREKIEKNSKSPKFIKAVWGIGYKMESL